MTKEDQNTSGQGSGVSQSSKARVQKRLIENGDIVVVMAKSAGTGEIFGDFQAEEEW